MNIRTILFQLAIPAVLMAVIGIYVYRDAKRRGMNGVLWTLIAVLAPSFIGFLIYLLVRGNYTDLKCPRCDAPVTEQYVVCPRCGTKLQPTCPSCSAPVEPDWKLCPKCARPLPADLQRDVYPPARPKDRTLWKVLAVIVAVPLLYILLAIFSMVSLTSTGSSSITVISVDDYLQEMQSPQIEAWFASAGGDPDTAYILEHQADYSEGVRVRYLIYLPKLTEDHRCDFDTGGGLFGNTFDIRFEDDGGDGGGIFILATYTADAVPKLKIDYNGKRVDTETKIVGFPIGLSDASTHAEP